MSHELRTPLTSIVGYTELLAEDLSGNLTDEQHQLVERIDRNGDRLLTPGRGPAHAGAGRGRQPALERVTTDLRERRPGGHRRGRPRRRTRAASRLHVDLPSEPVMLEGDPAYLERLVLNLVSNAVKFTDAGGEVEVDLCGRPATWPS